MARVTEIRAIEGFLGGSDSLLDPIQEHRVKTTYKKVSESGGEAGATCRLLHLGGMPPGPCSPGSPRSCTWKESLLRLSRESRRAACFRGLEADAETL